MNRILIVADDLTGALDAAAVLQRQGFNASVLLDATAPGRSFNHSTDVLAITTETRHLVDSTPLLRRLSQTLLRDRLIYKKIDSTLRGPIGSELVALLELTGHAAALVVPAFPAQGRQLVYGNLVVDGVPRDVHLPTLLESQTGRPIAHMSIDDVHAGPDPLMAALDRLIGTGASLIVLDAERGDDLGLIAQAVADLRLPTLIAGSAGFAAWLPLAWNLAPHQAASRSTPPPMHSPVLFVLGSPHPRTRAQLRAIRDQGAMQIEVAVVETEQGLHRPATAEFSTGTTDNRPKSSGSTTPALAKLQHVLTAAALNLKQAIAWIWEVPRSRTRRSAFAALAAA